MSININSFLNTFVQNQTSKLNKNTTSAQTSSGTAVNNSGVDDSIFAVASAVVADYKSQTGENKTSSSSTSGKSTYELASMSTKEFLNYASSNEAKAAFESEKSSDKTQIKLPMLVRYKTEVISTAGKTFMQVVAKFKAKFPKRSEEEIAATLMSKYATEEEISNIGEKYSVEYSATASATAAASNQSVGNKISFNA